MAHATDATCIADAIQLNLNQFDIIDMNINTVNRMLSKRTQGESFPLYHSIIIIIIIKNTADTANESLKILSNI